MKKILAFIFLLCALSAQAQPSTTGPLHGGTGASNPTAHSLALSEGSAVFNFLLATNPGTILQGGASDPTMTMTPSLGTSGAAAGTLTLFGGTSGSCIIQTAAAAGTSTVFQLPATNGANTNVLQTDGSGHTSWVAGGGSGTVTSVSVVTANGVSGSVATATTTPAITLTLGAITPSTINGLTLTALSTGFTVAGGTTSKTLTVPLDATVSGTNTGDQTITLTGGVTGSGTGSFAATVITNANLTGDVTSVGNATTFVASTVLGSHYIVRETPTGTVNGSNVTFTLANTPIAGTELVMLNGQMMDVGSSNDYTISTTTITFHAGQAPLTGDRLRVTYWK